MKASEIKAGRAYVCKDNEIRSVLLIYHTATTQMVRYHIEGKGHLTMRLETFASWAREEAK